MNKLEYIPGDLVTVETKLTKPRVVKVSNVDEDSVIYCEGWGEVCIYDEVKPIPITPEILEKNGWKKDGKWYCLSTKRAYLYIIQDTGQPDEFLICAGEDKHNLTSVSFVHQLQHFLFGLNLNSEMEV